MLHKVMPKIQPKNRIIAHHHRTFRSAPTLALLTLAASLTGGCLTAGELACTQDSDCYRGQVCADGVCADSANPQGSPDASDDATSCPATCTEDPYERERSFGFDVTPEDATRLGCDDDDVRDFSGTLVGNVCPEDTFGDYFTIPFDFCRDVSYQIEARLQVTSCPPDAFEVEFDPDCLPDTCETLPDGLRLTVPASPARPFLTFPIRIKKLMPDAHIDYTLSIQVLE